MVALIELPRAETPPLSIPAKIKGNTAILLVPFATLMTRLGLEVKRAKTRIARLPDESFDFLR